MTIEATSKDFNELIKKGKVIVNFHAEWCGPCKMLAPIFEQLSDEKKNVVFLKVDVDQEPKIAEEYKVSSIPTLLVFENGEKKKEERGLINKDKLADLIS